MRRLTSLFIIGLLTTTVPAFAQEEGAEQASSGPEFAGSYWTFGGLYYADNQNYDFLGFAGQSWPFGHRGGWTLRAGIGAGVALWGVNDAGLLGGTQLGLVRILTGDRLQLRDGRPLELYALVGGSAYAGRNLQDAPGQTDLVPAVSAGLGLRWRGTRASDPIVTLELYREERFSGFGPRLYIRFDYLRPRGVTRPTPPSSERP